MIGPPENPTIAGILIIITAIIWLIVEIYVLYYKKQTISSAMYSYAKNMPIIPFIIGLLMGHWFW
tara:strand:- start:234 stop:428 length:195 start_codon:yes stop_codon:yes gene_type:complete